MSEAPEWMEAAGLSEELTAHPALLETKDVAALAQRVVDGQSYRGQSVRVPTDAATPEELLEFQADLQAKHPHLNLVNVPGADAPDEVQEAFRQMLGAPKSVEDYKFDGLEVPEGTKLENIDGFKELALQLGLSDKQATALLGFDADRAVARGADMTQKIADSEAKLNDLWGDNAPGLRRAAEIAAEKYGGDELLAMVRDSDLGKNAAVMSALSKVGQALLEGGQAQIDNFDSRNFMSAAEAIVKESDIRGNRDHAFNNAQHPGHKAALEEMDKLVRIRLGKGHDQRVAPDLAAMGLGGA